MNLYKKIQKRTYAIVESADEHDWQSNLFDILIMLLVLVNVCCVILEIIPSISAKYANQLEQIELISVVIFSFEYLLRFWSCVSSAKYKGVFLGRIKYSLTPMALIDLIAILPFYLAFLSIDLRFIRVLRLARVLRIAKLAKYKKVQRFVTSYPLIMMFIGVFFSLCFCITVTYFAELKHNPNVDIIDTTKTIFLFFLGEYADEPNSFIGKSISFIIFLVGIGLTGAIIGKFSSFFVDMKRTKKVPIGLENHIVICNWNDMGDSIIKELHSKVIKNKKDIVVITENEIDESALRLNREYEGVYFMQNDPSLEEVLNKAAVQYASSVIILINNSIIYKDAENALISLSISNLIKDIEVKPWIIAELFNKERESQLKIAGVNEFICATGFSMGLIAQCALSKGLSDVFKDLLTISDSTNEFYKLSNYPASYIGKSFEELSKLINEERNDINPFILMGIERDGEVLINPRKRRLETLKEKDKLLLIAFDEPKI